MDLKDSILQTVHFSFSWLGNKAYHSVYLLLAVVYFFLNLFDVTTLNPSDSLYVVGWLVFVISLALLLYLSYKLLYDVLKLRYKDLIEFNVAEVVKLIVLSILSMLAAFFSVFELKWLALLAVAIVLGIGVVIVGLETTTALALGILAAIFAAAYGVVVIRNAMRLFVAIPAYLRSGDLIGSIKQSWDYTPTKALKLLLFSITLALIIGVVSLVELAPLFLADLADSAINITPAKPFYALVNAVISPFLLLFETFFAVSVYSWVIGKNTGVKARSKEKRIRK